MIRVTVDYDGEQAAPEPASAVIASFLRRSFSVGDVVKGALRGWLYGLIGVVLGATFGVYSIWTTPPSYTVSIGLLPTGKAAAMFLSDDKAAACALSALAGLDRHERRPGAEMFTRFVASLNATGVAKIMDQKYDMVCRTFACDPKTHMRGGKTPASEPTSTA